jgi:hypothetical protein
MFIDYLKAVWKAKKFRENLKSIQKQIRYFLGTLIQLTHHFTLGAKAQGGPSDFVPNNCLSIIGREL